MYPKRHFIIGVSAFFDIGALDVFQPIGSENVQEHRLRLFSDRLAAGRVLLKKFSDKFFFRLHHVFARGLYIKSFRTAADLKQAVFGDSHVSSDPVHTKLLPKFFWHF